jgi:hypothetical protein
MPDPSPFLLDFRLGDHSLQEQGLSPKRAKIKTRMQSSGGEHIGFTSSLQQVTEEGHRA